MYDLPQTREEVLELRKILGNDAVLLLGSDATETAFKSEPLEDFKIIHLATHGFADTEFPERSGLVLGVDVNSHDDGLLQVREIMRSEEHTSELQSHLNLVCRLLLEKKKKKTSVD